MDKKTIKKGIKIALMNRAKGCNQHPRASKYNDSAGLLLHKRKDRGAQWIYHYTMAKKRTIHKSISPSLHFYGYTFLRFYIFTERNSQTTTPHRSVNTGLQQSDFSSIKFPC
ncbi:hypothetical protein [Bartonella grahamii]|uniref:hypothetical protein n=1 Tax=Bartonella grahamii TaxID=33045 RepID=UPI00067481F4|nr:hypothetical protein [Bartonella grahamii]